MKVALDVSQTCVEVAGCGWAAHQIAQALSAKANPGLRIILYHHFGTWANSATDKGFFPDNPSVQSPLADMTGHEAKILWQKIGNGSMAPPGNPDLIHSHNFSAPNTGKIPLVYTVHDLAFWDLPHTSTETNRLLCQDGILQALENAAAFIFPSQFTQSRFLNFFGDVLSQNRQSHQVVYWGGRFPTISQPKSFSKDAPWLFVGSLDPRKNIHKLLQAFDLYWEKSRQKRTLLLAGPRGWTTGNEWNPIEALSKRGRARHLGYLSDPELLKRYGNAFALVWPSLYEGFGLPVLEAMSQGTPVITSNRTCLPEVGGKAAIYCNPDSIESIAAAMIELETEEEPYRDHSRKSLHQSTRFSWEETASELLKIYRDVITSSTCPSV